MFQFFQISYNRHIQQLKRSPSSKMKSLVIIFVICLSCCAYGEDVKPAKAIAVLQLSDKVFGSTKDNPFKSQIGTKISFFR
jgi:hypothetical protein